MAFDVDAIRHPKERIYGRATLIAGALLWVSFVVQVIVGEEPLLTAMTVVALVLLFWSIAAVTSALTRAYMFGHFVLVGPDQFPHIHAMVEDGAKKLGLGETPMTFVYNSDGVMNAFALRLIGKRRYIWLTSALVDANNEEQLRFVIGHELGHHVAGHLEQLPYILRWPVLVTPFLGAAYSRSRELTCDRIGAYLVRDLAASRTALQMLACGSAKLNAPDEWGSLRRAGESGSAHRRLPSESSLGLSAFDAPGGRGRALARRAEGFERDRSVHGNVCRMILRDLKP
jgi:Zn-dependent protease with chaperone function